MKQLTPTPTGNTITRMRAACLSARNLFGRGPWGGMNDRRDVKPARAYPDFEPETRIIKQKFLN